MWARQQEPGKGWLLMAYSGRGGVQLSWSHYDQHPDMFLESVPQAGSRFYHWVESDPVPAGTKEAGEVVQYRHSMGGFGADGYSIVRQSIVGADGHLRGPNFRRELYQLPVVTTTVSTRRVWFPHAVLVASAGWLPLRWLGRWRRVRRRASLGLCSDCGYDLRASGNRCPECGRVKLLAP